ncbi:MAG: hypothetical protein LBC51_04320 [Treponema sp.]|jgi:hypothetical protein|nr:hypothetical protein [Treponema sp.]
MINELYALANALERAKISPYEWHKELKTLPKVEEKKPLYRIWLSRNREVYRIDTITDQESVHYLRKWEKDFGCSFPAFNVSALYRFKTKKELDLLSEKERNIEKAKKELYGKWLEGKAEVDVEKLRSWCNEAKSNRDEQEIKIIGNKIEKCFHRAPSELLKKIGGAHVPHNVITDLIRILEKITVEDFYAAIEQYVFKVLAKRKDSKLPLNFLFAEKQLSVILDVEDYESTCPVVHETTIQWINKELIRAERNTTVQKVFGSGNDAFGSAYTEVGETMPEVKLPSLGGVKLRSMFAAHKCQERYGLIEDASYPITRENRAKIKKSLEWLSQEEQKGKTWGPVEAKELLFAYPSSIPPVIPRFAALLGAAGKDANPEKFASRAESVFQAIKGLPQAEQPKDLQLFAIRKMDKARSKVVFYRTYSMQSLNESAVTWQAGCENIPVFDIWVWAEQSKPPSSEVAEKHKVEILQTESIDPLQTARILNKVWKLDGSSSGEILRIKYSQGIELFFSDLSAGAKQHLLNVLLINYKGLLSYLGNKTHRNHNSILSYAEKESCAAVFSLFGLLLYKQNCYKEDYMENMPYQLGQLLKVADELHALYCKVVRDDNVPPQLVGNSLFVAATETPVQALAQLSPRFSPYLAWAKQYRTKNIEEKGRESWRAAWYVYLMESIATKLCPSIRSIERFNDLEKAQFFIGYLAEFPKREKSDGTSQETASKNEK